MMLYKIKRISVLLIMGFFMALSIDRISDLLYPTNGIIRNWKAFYAQDENSIDLLIVGSSHAYSSFNIDMFSETGERAYILASNSQTVTQAYYNVQEALRYQKPNKIILEAFSFNENSNWQNDEYETYDKDWKKESNIDGMHFGWVKVEAILNQYNWKNWPYAFFRICRSHHNWKNANQIQTNYHFTRVRAKVWNPFRPNKTQMSQETVYKYQKMKKDETDFVISDVNIEHFHKLAELCREKDIRLIVVMAPMYDGYIDKINYESQYEAILSLANEESVEYIDCNYAYDEIGMKSSDFEDAYSSIHHMNEQGAEKVSRYIIGRIADYEKP